MPCTLIVKIVKLLSENTRSTTDERDGTGERTARSDSGGITAIIDNVRVERDGLEGQCTRLVPRVRSEHDNLLLCTIRRAERVNRVTSQLDIVD
jgi:hypothetical protein